MGPAVGLSLEALKSLNDATGKKRSNRSFKKIDSWERWLLKFLGPLMRVRLPLMKIVLTPLAKSVLIPSA